MRRTISTERQVAISLWVLATPGEYRVWLIFLEWLDAQFAELSIKQAEQLYRSYFLRTFASQQETAWRKSWEGSRKSMVFHNVLAP